MVRMGETRRSKTEFVWKNLHSRTLCTLDFTLLHLNHRNPLPRALLRKYDPPAENLRCSRWRQIAVKAEESALQIFPGLPTIQHWMRRLVFCREHQRNLEVRAELSCREHFLQRKILDTHNLHRPRDIAQPGTG